MRIDTKQTIGGLPILKLRDYFRRQQEFNVSKICYGLSVTEKQAVKVIDELIQIGYVEKITDEHFSHGLTEKGMAFAAAKGLPPLSIIKARLIVEKFVDTAKRINNDPYYLYQVEKAILFGSVLGSSDTVNDIDIAMRVTPKEKDPEKLGPALEKRRNEARLAGKRFRRFIDLAFYPFTEVTSELRKVSRYISYHDLEDTVLEKAIQLQLIP